MSDLKYYQDLAAKFAELYADAQEKIEAVDAVFQVHYSTLHDCAWMDREKMLKALDETAEMVREKLRSSEKMQSSDEKEDSG